MPRTLLIHRILHVLPKSMTGDIVDPSLLQGDTVLVQVSHDLVSVEALLKVCYWFSRDFVCDVTHDSADRSTVRLKAKSTCEMTFPEAREQFMVHALDFALRERVTAKTSGVRDLLLAKAFSESGVLEDQPQGVFGDSLEESKPDGMFKILSNQ
jgi:His-Xaa-Ser system protein HxsD